MTNFSNRAPAEHTADDGSMVGFFTGAIILLAGLLMVATQFSLA